MFKNVRKKRKAARKINLLFIRDRNIKFRLKIKAYFMKTKVKLIGKAFKY